MDLAPMAAKPSISQSAQPQTQERFPRLHTDVLGLPLSDGNFRQQIERPDLQTISLRKASAISAALHVLFPIGVVGIILFTLLILSLILNMPFWDWFKQKEETRDMVFTLVEPSQDTAPKKARYFGAHNQQAGAKPEPLKKLPTQPNAQPDAVTGSPKQPDPMPVARQALPPIPQQKAEEDPNKKIEEKEKPVPVIGTPDDTVQKPSKKTIQAPESPKAVATEEVLEAGTSVGNTSLPSGEPETEAGPNDKPGVAVVQDVDFSKFMEELERRIKRNWHPPRGSHTKKAVLLIEVARDGKLISVEVDETSGDERFDASAIKATERSAPFEELPPQYHRESVSVLYTFDYTVFGGSRRDSNQSKRSQ